MCFLYMLPQMLLAGADVEIHRNGICSLRIARFIQILYKISKSPAVQLSTAGQCHLYSMYIPNPGFHSLTQDLGGVSFTHTFS